ncbi:MAG: glutaredoxin [Clostridia bacterium]|nr:glutaredoxin [Clostridia bacterium]
MAKITIFYLEHCPYCRNAQKAVTALKAENAAFNAVDIEWIEESRQPDVAGKFDYYYVPAIFLDAEKLYECSPADDYEAIRKNIKAALERAV